MPCLSSHSDIGFTTDHPLHYLHRVNSTTSDGSDCTLPTETINVDICQSQETGGNFKLDNDAACRDADYISENALAISVNGGDMPAQQFLTLHSSVSNDHDHPSTSSMTNEQDSSSPCKALFLHMPFVEAEHSHYLARPGSPGESSMGNWDMWSSAS